VVSGPLRGTDAIASISARKSPTACHRRFGFFSRHRRSSSASPWIEIRRQRRQIRLACQGRGEDRLRNVARAGLKAGPYRIHRFRKAEIEDLHSLARRDLHVRRFQIAVDDALFVRRLERVGDLLRNRKRFFDRDRRG
jgi:hypothetical protein